MAKLRAVTRDSAGRFAKRGSGGKVMAIRMPKNIRNSVQPTRSNRAIRASRKKIG